MARILDLCCGTGDLVFQLLRTDPTLDVTGIDFCARCSIGRRRAPRSLREKTRDSWKATSWRCRSPDQAFDGATMGFSMRNVVDIVATLREILRVLRPGARFVNLDVCKAPNPRFRHLFDLYFYGVVPLLGGLIGGSREAYRYLPNSLTHYPDAGAARSLRVPALWTPAYLPLVGGSDRHALRAAAVISPTRVEQRRDLDALVEDFFRHRFQPTTR